MERCPTCRARWDGAERCRRCGLDLSLAFDAERAAGRLLAHAIERLAAADTDAALVAIGRARRLVEDPLIDHLLAFASAHRQREIDAHLQALARALGRPGVEGPGGRPLGEVSIER
ncbi:hypothetical protein [Thiococcus pfennigii]|uniref:hypothetical protein n=1 Tax=Thiococcus pfennigii TaxID=1057 RepID=UPI001904E884|nr:hypothetical protein [Thiococcus pfennigii]MBK1730325.1 hypothetical protein [Thiococcus pfennigii]